MPEDGGNEKRKKKFILIKFIKILKINQKNTLQFFILYNLVPTANL